MTAATKTAVVAGAILGLATMLGVLPGPALAEGPAVMLEKGIYQEETAGDLDAAMKIYKTILEEAKTDRKFVAQAQYRLGMCYLKKGQSRQAIATMQELVTAYADQKELVAKAKQALGQARGKMSPQEVAEIVSGVVTTISTCAETDPQVPKALALLDGLDSEMVVKALAKHLASDQNTIRRSAIYILWKAELPDVAAAVPDLEKLCSHEEEFTRGMAGIALGARKVASAYPLLCKMTLEDASGYARRSAAYALGLLARPEASEVLQKALKDPDSLVRANAEAALTLLSQAGGGTGRGAAPAAPKVVSTVPPNYADDVPASLARLSVTFHRKMKDGCWAWVQRFKDKYPQTTGTPSYDANATTCSLPVKLEPGKVYWLELNSPPYTSFMAVDGTLAARHVLVFATKAADGKATPIPADLLARAKAVNESARRPAPTVVRTHPVAFDNNVPASQKEIGVRFDQPMLDQSWSWVQADADTYPQATDKPRYDSGRTTCVLPVILEPGKVYWVQINSAQHRFFQSPAQVPARPYVILFATRGADGKPTPIPPDLLAQARAINEGPQSQPAVERRKVDKPLASLPDKQDLTSPEGAWAAWQRANVAKDANALVDLSWIKLDPAATARFWRNGDPDDMQMYLQAIKDSKLLEVLTWGDDFAGAVGLLVFPEGKGRHPYSLRYLGQVGGQWKNLGEDRCVSLDDAAATFERKKQRIQAQLAGMGKSAAPAAADKRAAAALAAEGWRLWGQKKFPEAEKTLRQAVEKDPTNATAWNGLGWAQHNQGELIEAARSFEKCLAVDPKVPGALNGLGWIAKAQGRPDEAIAYWRKAIAADPRAGAARAGLAAVFSERGEFDLAEKEYQAALMVDPADASAKTGLATVVKAREAAKAALAAAEAWLVSLDAGDYGKTWDEASALVKKVTTKDGWESTVKAAVTPLGKPGQRKVTSTTYMTSMPGAPDGEYVIVQFRTAYEKKKDAIEVVTPMKDTDGKWRVSGYYLR